MCIINPFIHSPFDGCLGYFHFGSIVNGITMNTSARVL